MITSFIDIKTYYKALVTQHYDIGTWTERQICRKEWTAHKKKPQYIQKCRMEQNSISNQESGKMDFSLSSIKTNSDNHLEKNSAGSISPTLH